MSELVFVLKKNRPWKRSVRVFKRNGLGKVTSVNCMFTTEHLVSEAERLSNARNNPAEFKTTNQDLIEALFRDSAYGKDFVLKSDPEGKLKKPTLLLSKADIDYAALQQLYVTANLPFDPRATYDELLSGYSIHIQALAGKRMEISPPAPVQYAKTDPAQDIYNQKVQATTNYENKYGEPVPDVVANDIAFLDAMLNIDFDAEKYIAAKLEKQAEEAAKPKVVEEDTFESLDAKYFEKFKTHIPNNKKSDLSWVKNKLNS